MTGQMAPALSPNTVSALDSESNLVAAARAGDDRAFTELYARYQDRIRAFILGKVHDHGRAEDIAQEVFISALRRLRVSEQTIAFKPWIYEIAKNACIDEFRRRRRVREVSLDADQDLASDRRGLMALAPTPAAAIESKLQLEDLQGAFSGLSETHHKLLVMRELEGRSYSEIAATMGMSLPMVESALFRARRKLTEEYDELASGRRCGQVQAAIDTGRVQSLRSMGVRERRQLTRHLSHCQPCRREALLAGVDESLVKPRSIAARIAALLPFPLWRWPWGGGSGGGGTGGSGGVGANVPAGGRASGRGLLGRTGGHHLSATQSLQSVAGAVGPTGTSITLGQAAATVAALAIAGAGGGAVTGLWGSRPAAKPAALTRLVRTSSAAAVSTHLGSGAASIGVARASGASAGAPGLQVGQPLPLNRGSLTGTAGNTAPRSGPPSATTSSTTRTPGTTSPTRAGGKNRVGGTTATTKTGGSLVTRTTGKVAGAPSRTVSIVTGVTHTSVPTVGKVLRGTVGRVVQGTSRVLRGTVGRVVQGTSRVLRGTVGRVVQGTGRVLRGTVGRVVHGTGGAVAGTVGRVVHGTGGAVAGTVGRVVHGTGSAVAGTVGGVVQGTVGRVLPPPLPPPASRVLPPSASGATGSGSGSGSGTSAAGGSAASSSSAASGIVAPVTKTAKKISRTLGDTLSGLLP